MRRRTSERLEGKSSIVAGVLYGVNYFQAAIYHTLSIDRRSKFLKRVAPSLQLAASQTTNSQKHTPLHPKIMTNKRRQQNLACLLTWFALHSIDAIHLHRRLGATQRIVDYRQESPFARRLIDPFIGHEEEDLSSSSSLVNATSTNVTAQVVSNVTDNNETIVYTLHKEDPLRDEAPQPIRLRAILAHNDLLLPSEKTALMSQVMSPALTAWSSALRVQPVVGNLTVDAHQLVDGQLCGPGNGLPSIQVPTEDITLGIPETDMIVYLSLGFVQPRNQTWVEAQLHPEDRFLNQRENTVTTDSFCNGDFLAASSFCSTDQFDRPTAALLHICIDQDFFEPHMLHRNILTILHELGHALGFNALSMAHFRRPDGTPYTPRDRDGQIRETKIECTGPHAERRSAKVTLPSSDILQFHDDVRGGVRVAEIVTPSVLQVVRNQFDCQELTGAELESGEGLPFTDAEDQGCIGDHWERRLFSSDLMNPVIDDLEFSPRISTLTLALFADSGWYQVDLSGAKVEAGWGRGAGCNFVNDTCIGKDGQVPPYNAPFFCNDVPTAQSRSITSEIHGCTPDLSRKAICSMGQYDLELPQEYQYFNSTYGSDVGGQDPLMDFCPVYTGFDNGLCSNAANEAFVKTDVMEEFGRRNSRCLMGTVHPLAPKTALCLPIACVVEDRSLRVRVQGTWHTCTKEGQEIVESATTILCPDPIRICPTFYCPLDCLGIVGGVCDYESGQCLCEHEEEGLYGPEMVWKECGAALNHSNPEEFVPKKPLPVPHPDSPLSDYYVRDSRALEERKDRLLDPWMIAVVTVGAAIGVAIVTVSLATWHARKNRETPVETHHRNKDKMVATVLVDMRIRHPSVADTDERLTDSVAGSVPSEILLEDDESSNELQLVRRGRVDV